MKKIRKADKNDINKLVEIIKLANIPIAKELDLTIENCPKHPSNCNSGWIADAMGKGEVFFILELDTKSVGCIAYESTPESTAYVNRLAVIPEFQNRGFGQELMKYHEDYTKINKKTLIGIGVIDNNTVLKSWYKKLGYIEQRVKKFKHLPFDVCFMDKKI